MQRHDTSFTIPCQFGPRLPTSQTPTRKQNILIETNVKGLAMVPNVEHGASDKVYVKSMAAQQLKLPFAITC